MKEILECYSHKELYLKTQNQFNDLKSELKKTSIQLTLPYEEYCKFIDLFKEHDAFKLIQFQISAEVNFLLKIKKKQVFCKFLFDLCTTWCEFLDIELFCYFIYSIFLQITDGSSIQNSKLKNTMDIQPFSPEYFSRFEQMKANYNINKKKHLRYYRAWCETNYLKLNVIGESLILNLNELFGQEDDNRIIQLISIFEKAIDTINNEISSQVTTKQNNVNTYNNNASLLNNITLNDQNITQNILNQYSNLWENNNQILTKKQIQQELQIDLFSLDFDENKGGLIVKRQVKMPIIGKKIDPLPFEESKKRILKDDIINEHYYKYQLNFDILNNQYEEKNLQQQKKSNNSSSLNKNVNQEFKLHHLDESMLSSNKKIKQQSSLNQTNIYKKLNMSSKQIEDLNSSILNKPVTPKKDQLYIYQTDKKKQSNVLDDKIFGDSVGGRSALQKIRSLTSNKKSKIQNVLAPSFGTSREESADINFLMNKQQEVSYLIDQGRFFTKDKQIFRLNNKNQCLQYQGYEFTNSHFQEEFGKINNNIQRRKKINKLQSFDFNSLQISEKEKQQQSQQENQQISQQKLIQENKDTKNELEKIQKQKNLEQLKKGSNQEYQNLINENRHIWNKYFQEDELYFLNEWDSLYKIISVLKRKEQDKVFKTTNYLQYINVDLAPYKKDVLQLPKNMKPEEIELEMGGQITQIDKELFHKRVQSLLAREKRRRLRRRKRLQKKKILILNYQQKQHNQNKIKTFKDKDNKQLFKEVFLPQINQQ